MSKVWIDLENTPHVPFFAPWIERLTNEGHEVLLTARDLSQTHELLREANLPFTPIGGHGAGHSALRALRSLARALALAMWARGKHIDLALGHGSRGQAMAARLLGVPALTFLDYEHVSLGVFARCSAELLVPDPITTDALPGFPPNKVVRYPGIKELLYLDPAEDARRPSDPPVILIRPPARLAHYHSLDSEKGYEGFIELLANEAKHCRVLFVPRYADDAQRLGPWLQSCKNFEILKTPESTRDLLLSASLVASGGGTMIREAALLGVPAVSFFGGKIGAVDRWLSEQGLLTLVRNSDDLNRITLPTAGAPAPAAASFPSAKEAREFIASRLEYWLTRGNSR